MARQPKKTSKTPSETMVSKASNAARDNPVAAGGAVVMGLTVCLIVANALGLQPDPHPAPLFSTRERSLAPGQAGSPGAGSTVRAPQVSALVLDLQVSLRRLGLYEGPLDGINGPATERAIRAFERRTGRIETGQPDEALLAVTLLQSGPLSTSDEAQVPVPLAKPERSRASVSGRLSTGRADRTGIEPVPGTMEKVLAAIGHAPLVADGLRRMEGAAAARRV